MFTLVHAFANYFLAIPFRKRIDLIALLIASILPDLEGLYYMPAALAACGGDTACAAAYPSHFMLHSLFGVFLIIAPIALITSVLLRKRMRLASLGTRVIYFSALFGGLLHILADATYHTGADALYLLWPLPTQFSFAFGGSDILWNALGGIGLFAFILLEKKHITALSKVK